VCRRLFLVGLGELCREFGLEEKSRSVLFACCTSGLVGGKSVIELSDERDVARDRGAVRLSRLRGSIYETSCRFAWYAAEGKERSQGTTGDVARKSEDEMSLLEAHPVRFSLKSPECNADLGRSISRPATAGSRKCSGADVCGGCESGVGARGDFERSWEMGRMGVSGSSVMSLWSKSQRFVWYGRSAL
jgi:hypothetical protein